MAEQKIVIEGPQTWSPAMRGRALEIVWVLANTSQDEWRSKPELHGALKEFQRRKPTPIAEEFMMPIGMAD